MVYGVNKKKGIFDEYIGKYVIIHPATNTTYLGKITKIEGDYAVLNPHQTVIYEEGKNGIKKLIGESSLVRISGAISIEPTTRENLENYCKYINKEAEKERHKEK